MAIIKPYSAFTTDDVTLDNFPALAYAWTSDYGFTPGDAWVDRIRGLSLIPHVNSTLDANGAVLNGGLTKPSTATGVDQLPGTKDVLLLAVGYMTANQLLGIGDVVVGASECIGVGTGTSQAYTVVTAVPTNYITMAPAAAGVIGTSAAAPGIMGTYIDWSTKTQKAFNTANDGTQTYSAAGSVTEGDADAILSGISTLTSAAFIGIGGTTSVTYGMYLLYFESGIPSEAVITEAMQWMVANPTKGLYPGFIGIA